MVESSPRPWLQRVQECHLGSRPKAHFLNPGICYHYWKSVLQEFYLLDCVDCENMCIENRDLNWAHRRGAF